MALTGQLPPTLSELKKDGHTGTRLCKIDGASWSDLDIFPHQLFQHPSTASPVASWSSMSYENKLEAPVVVKLWKPTLLNQMDIRSQQYPIFHSPDMAEYVAFIPQYDADGSRLPIDQQVTKLANVVGDIWATPEHKYDIEDLRPVISFKPVAFPGFWTRLGEIQNWVERDALLPFDPIAAEADLAEGRVVRNSLKHVLIINDVRKFIAYQVASATRMCGNHNPVLRALRIESSQQSKRSSIGPLLPANVRNFKKSEFHTDEASKVETTEPLVSSDIPPEPVTSSNEKGALAPCKGDKT